MKIIEALKNIKDLKRKSDDLVSKIKAHSADLDFETPTYPDQKDQVMKWVQAHTDVVREIGSLSYRLQKTNITTMVTITVGDNHVTKSISQWIVRRKELATMEAKGWYALGDRGLKDSRIQTTSGSVIDSKVRRYYDPRERDKMLMALASEPSLIDGKLEIVNATHDLME